LAPFLLEWMLTDISLYGQINCLSLYGQINACLVSVNILMATAKILVVKAGKSTYLARLPCQPTCLTCLCPLLALLFGSCGFFCKLKCLE